MKEGKQMKKFRTIVSLVIMVVAGIVGIYAGGYFRDAIGGATLFSMIAGIACIIYTIDNHNE